ncbi:MAG: NAD(P)/FAD-dependent oxidoreductase [Erysipelotrichaceae bacterium]|nr:NAD(P)/FAD-dependent oxidoreductase [Erysipelotrichaceae bacterium]
MYDVIIIGAGIVGSSVAYYLSRYNLNVVLLEKENDVSNGTTKANSAIIHAGYDPEEGTLMAKHNVRGSRLAKQLCEKLDVPYKQCGAMVLGFDEEDEKTVRMLYQRGLNNGVEGLEILNKEQILEKEPQISSEVRIALLAKTSAIVSPWEYALALAETAVRNGVEIKLNNEVKAIKKTGETFLVTTDKGIYEGKYIINCAGLYADKIQEMAGEKEFEIRPSRGQYYLLDKAEGKRCSHTIFQCPSKVGKGVLVSPTVHGNLIVGPNAEESENDDTSTTMGGLAFVKVASRKSVPNVDFRENIRNFAGVRARSDRSDFILEESRSVKNLFNIAGIKSPGLSAAPSLALEAVEWLKGKGVVLTEKEHFIDERKRVRFKELSGEEKQELIRKEPAYGRVICRCETITEGEILDALKRPIPPVSIDGVKRRCNAGMGRCQGGFCSERVADILMRELHLNGLNVLQDKEGSNVLLDYSKGGNSNV